MDNFYLSALVQEIAPEVQGRTVAHVSLEASTLLMDLRLASGRQLLASVDRTTPALFLSSEVASQTSKGRRTSTFFLSLVRKYLVDAKLVRLRKEPLDRIVHIEFEKLDAGDNVIQIFLRLELTGRSANAYLIDARGSVMGTLFEQTGAASPAQPVPAPEPCDPEGFITRLDDSMTESEAVNLFFGGSSIFGPQLKSEFLARCQTTKPAGALRSLIEDLFHRDPLPLLYSKLPLDQTHRVVINTRSDLLLSNIELAQGRGLLRFQFPSLSEAADKYYSVRGPALTLRAEYAALKQTLAREINKRETALIAIESDRSRFANPEKLKHCGDLILANLANARTDGRMVTVVDYYDPDQPEIQIEIPEGARLQEAASDYFARYQKARRALAAIASREQEVSRNLDPLRQLLAKLEREPTVDCIAEIRKEAGQLPGITIEKTQDKSKGAKNRTADAFGRRFKSSDGYEIVVGRNDRDNDALTFRLARPHDIWLHAADYPGSHAIIRNPTREDLPHRTITEAAELAAYYSQAKREGKASVHYAQKKFVSKPPRSKPGLVRLSSFKTIVVEPRCNLERLL